MPAPTLSAELDAKARDALRSSQFAYVDPDGGQHLPINDEEHVRAALGRFSQTQFHSSAAKASARRKIVAAAKRFGIDVGDDSMKLSEPLLVAGPKIRLAEDVARTAKAGEIVRLPYVAVGEWDFRDSYGKVPVTDTDLRHIVDNFHRDARRQDLPLLVNEEHAELPAGADVKSYIGPGAIGYIKDLVHGADVGLRPDMVYQDVDLNALGERLLKEDRYRNVSPELLLNWTDPETDQYWGMTAAGSAVTTMPRMKGLSSRVPLLPGQLAASETRARVLAFAEPSNRISTELQTGSGTPPQMPPGGSGTSPDGGVGFYHLHEHTHDDGTTHVHNHLHPPYTQSHDGANHPVDGPINHDHDHLRMAELITPTDADPPDASQPDRLSHDAGGSGVGSEKDELEHSHVHTHADGTTHTHEHMHRQKVRHDDATHSQDVHGHAHVTSAAIRSRRMAEADGDGMTTCPTCDGKKTIRGGAMPCPDCKGTGKVKASELAVFSMISDVHIDRPLGTFSVAYAFPDKKRLPLNSAEGVKAAVARFMTIDASEEERDAGWRHVILAADQHKVDVPTSWRRLNATECARMMLAEGDSEDEAMEPRICVYQPRPDGSFMGSCPGYTRPAKDDMDGDYDACALWEACNGYIPYMGDPVHAGPLDTPPDPAPVQATPVPALDSGAWASPSNGDSPYHYAEGGRMTEPTHQPTAAPAAAPAAAPPAPPAAPAPVAAAPAPAPASSPADMSEMRNLLQMAETRATQAEGKLTLAEGRIEALEANERKRESAAKLIKVSERMEKLVFSGRMSPAQRQLLEQPESLAKFAEDPTFEAVLAAFEAAPANSVVPLAERGSGEQPTDATSSTAGIAAQAQAYQAKKMSEGTKISLRDATIAVATPGFRGV